MEGPIFGGAYERREICVIKSVGLNCSGQEIYHFCFVLLCIRKLQSTSPPGGLYSKGRFNGGFFALRLWGLIFGGAFTWGNFTISDFTIIAVQLYLKANRFEFPLFWVAIQC